MAAGSPSSVRANAASPPSSSSSCYSTGSTSSATSYTRSSSATSSARWTYKVYDEPRTPRYVHGMQLPFFSPSACESPTFPTPVSMPQSPCDLRFTDDLDSPETCEHLPCRDEPHVEEMEEDGGIAEYTFFRHFPTTGIFAKIAHPPLSPPPRLKCVDSLRAYLEERDGEEPSSPTYLEYCEEPTSPGQWEEGKWRRNEMEETSEYDEFSGMVRDDDEHERMDHGTDYCYDDELDDLELLVDGRLLRAGEGYASERGEERGECVSPRDTRSRV